MKKTTRNLLALAMAVAMTTTMTVQNTYAYDYTFQASTEGIQTSNNVTNSVESSTKYGQPIKSVIDVADDGTITRLESVNGNIFVETYNSNYEYIKTLQLPYELPIFGGAYFGSEYNFLVFGQLNTNEHEDREVVRVVKYDKNWNPLGSVSAYGINTQTPFSSSGVAMIEQNGILYIRTSHRMMKSDDGKNHQATLSMGVNIEDMTFSGMVYKLDYKEKGYISHSFNSLLTKTGEEIIAVDLGDAYPRAIVAFRGKNPAGGTLKNTNLFEIPGPDGDNSTGISLGGLEYTSYTSSSAVTVTNNAVVAGRMSQDYSEATYGKIDNLRNVFVTVASINDDGTIGANDIKLLTNYTRSEGINTTTPKLVKIAEDRLYVMWQEYTSDVSNATFKYALIDNNGNLVSSIMTAPAKMSDCQPIVVDNNVMWYATSNGAPVFYTLDIETNEVTAHEAVGPTNVYDKIVVEYEPEKPADPEPEKPTDPGTDSGDNGDDDDNSTNNSGNTTTSDKAQEDYNKTLVDLVNNSKAPTINLTTDNNKAIISSTTVDKIVKTGKPLTVTQGNTTMSIPADSLKNLDLDANDKLSVSMVKQNATLSTVDISSNSVNNDLLNNAVKIEVKVNNTPVDDFGGTVQVAIDVSNYGLTEAQMSKLQAIEVLPSGVVNYLDSEIIDGKVIFNVDNNGVYAVVLFSDPVSIEIDLNNGSYMINNQEYIADATPKIINGRTMVPIRVIAEAFGADVKWEATTKTINISLDNKNVEMVVGQTTEGMDVPPTIIDGRTYVPLRYVSEVLDANVDWNQESSKITITK